MQSARKTWLSVLCILSFTIGSLPLCQSFTTLSSSSSSCRRWLDNNKRPRFSSLASAVNNNHNNNQGTLSDEVFCVSWDGVLANTADWRIAQSLRIAQSTWPSLPCLSVSQEKNSNLDWLYNKMKALSYCLGGDNEEGGERDTKYSLTCEYALLARCLLEEQQLDRGRSVGKTGKYASKFHPSTTTTGNDASTPEQQDQERRRRIRQMMQRRATGSSSSSNSSSQSRQRPLTVGEIGANWSEGAYLKDTLLARYHVDGQDPFHVLQQHLDDDDDDTSSSMTNWPVANPLVCEALLQCPGQVVIMVGHDSDVEAVHQSLPPLLLEKADIVSSVSETDILQQYYCDTTNPNDSEQPQESNRGLFVHCVSSNYNSLLKSQRVLGADGSVPRVLPGQPQQQQSQLPQRGIGLALAAWAENTHVSQRNDAEMNPWTHLLHETEFTEMVSARIVSSSSSSSS